MLLYHIHPNGSLTLDQLSAAGNLSTVLGQDLSADYPLTTSTNATNGVGSCVALLLRLALRLSLMGPCWAKSSRCPILKPHWPRGTCRATWLSIRLNLDHSRQNKLPTFCLAEGLQFTFLSVHAS